MAEKMVSVIEQKDEAKRKAKEARQRAREERNAWLVPLIILIVVNVIFLSLDVRAYQAMYKITGDNLSYRWTNCIDGFEMPVRLAGSGIWLKPTAGWQNTTVTAGLQQGLEADKNFYITVKKIE